MTTVTKPFADKYFSYPDILSPSLYAANPNIRVQHHPYESAFNCRPASTPGFGAAHGYAARPRQTRGLSRPSGSSWPKLSLPPSRQRRGTGGHPSPGAPGGCTPPPRPVGAKGSDARPQRPSRHPFPRPGCGPPPGPAAPPGTWPCRATITRPFPCPGLTA